MIILDMEQRTAEWYEVRRGIPTASQFHRLLTPKTMKPSSQAHGYLRDLVTEWALHCNLDEQITQLMERGSDLEARAFAYYELEREVELRQVGFILRDDRLVGCSPDGLVGERGDLELKCPGGPVHVGYLLGDDPDQYTCQVQGRLWIEERDWVDLLAFHPNLPPVLRRYARDGLFIRSLAAVVDEFLGTLHEAKEKMIALGVTPLTAPAIAAEAPQDLSAAFRDVLA